MPIRAEVWRSFYQNSMALMRLAAELRERPGVLQSAALMGTPANHQLLASSALRHKRDTARHDHVQHRDAPPPHGAC